MKYLKVWTNFKDFLGRLEDDEIGRLFMMMLTYAESGEEPTEFEGNESFLFPVAKQMIDLAAEKNEKLRQNGSKGGIAKSKNKQTLANDSNSYQTVANDSNVEQLVAYKEKKRNEMKRNEKERNDIKRFTPPTKEEIDAYCEERGVFLIDPQRFIDYYETRGWMLTKNRKMVDWKAAVRLWEKNERERQKEQDADMPY